MSYIASSHVLSHFNSKKKIKKLVLNSMNYPRNFTTYKKKSHLGGKTMKSGTRRNFHELSCYHCFNLCILPTDKMALAHIDL